MLGATPEELAQTLREEAATGSAPPAEAAVEVAVEAAPVAAEAVATEEGAADAEGAAEAEAPAADKEGEKPNTSAPNGFEWGQTF